MELSIRSDLRASDAERDEVIELLRHAHAEGRLDNKTFDARMSLAPEAVTIGSLASLVADLPVRTNRRQRAVTRIRSLGRTRLSRRWLHIAAVPASLIWAVAIPIYIYFDTIRRAAVPDGPGAVVLTDVHPAIATGLLWLFVITGVTALIANIVFWAKWETE